MTDLSQSNTFPHHVKTSPNGKARKVYFAVCPRCSQLIDLKGKRIEDSIGATRILVFKAHRDQLASAPCPMAGHTPEDAARWQADVSRRHLGLPEVANVA